MKNRKVLAFFLTVVVLLQIVMLPINATENTSFGKAYIFTSNAPYSSPYLEDIEDNIGRLLYECTFLNNQYGTTMYDAIKTKEVVIIDPIMSGAGYVRNTGPTSIPSLITGCNRNAALSNLTHTNSVFMNSASGVSNKVNMVTVYLGSYTATTPERIPDNSQLDGFYYPVNLVNATYLRLSKCVIGWQSSIGGYTGAWTASFTYNICEETLADAMSIAAGYMFREYGSVSGQGYANYFCRGDTTQIIGGY